MAAADAATTALVDAATTLTTAAVDAATSPAAKAVTGLTFDKGAVLGIPELIALALILLIPLGFAALFTSFSMQLARKLGALAVPNVRSSHTVPTPRLGGIGLFVSITAAFLVIQMYPLAFYGPAWGLSPALITFVKVGLICGGLAFFVGLLDDLLPLPPGFKLIGQIAVAALFVYIGGKMTYEITGTTIFDSGKLTSEKVTFSGAGFDRIALTRALVLDGRWDQWVATLGETAAKIPKLPVLMTVLWLVIFMNAYNFMDGIDGLAAAFVIAVAVGVFATWMPEAAQISQLRAHICFNLAFAMLLIGASLGFLFYNWPPARTFLGDCGSQYIGFIVAAFLAQLTLIEAQPAVNLIGKKLELALARRAYVDFLACVILVWPFLYDVIYTLIRRLVRLRPIWRAHHEHLYQRLIDLRWSHRAVVLFSFPFYLAHAALYYAYCWAPDERMRATWAVVALAPMIIYTITVMACEKTARLAVAPATPPEAGEGSEEEPPQPAETREAPGVEKAEAEAAPAEAAEEGVDKTALLESPPDNK